MSLNYLTESELEMDRDSVNLQIALGLQSCETKENVCQLLEDVRAHEVCLLRKELRQPASQELQEKLDGIEVMGNLCNELKKIPWYRFSERKAQKQKIEALRMRQRGCIHISACAECQRVL